MSNTLRRGRHVVCNLHVNLVFVSKYRGEIFTKEVLRDMEDIFENVCAKFEAELVEFNGGSDYVHLLIAYPAKVAVSNLVNSLKGVSSRLLRKNKYTSVPDKVWKDALWSPSYLAKSCGDFSLESIHRYIEKQNKFL